MSDEIFKVLHIEDEGEYRRFFQTDVLRVDVTPFRAVHLNRVEETLSDEELGKRAVAKLGSHTDIKFVVVDLAMDDNQHIEFDKLFANDQYPDTPPDGLPGGIGIVARIIRDTEFPPQNIAFLTRHAPSNLFTKLSFVTKHWFGTTILHYLKTNADNVVALQEHIIENVGWTGKIEAPSNTTTTCDEVEAPKIDPRVDVVVACLSDRESTLHAIGVQVLELAVNSKPHYEAIKTNGDGSSAFATLQAIVSKESKNDSARVAIFAVVDFTNNQCEDDAFVDAVKRKDWNAVARLPGVQELKRLIDSEAAQDLKRLFKIVALTSAVQADNEQWLERNFMRKVGVDYVVDQETLTADFLQKTVKFLTAIQPLVNR